MTGEDREGLPQGWEETTFGELNIYSSRNIDPADFPEETFELYSVPNFPQGVPEFPTGADIGSTKQAVQTGDVLVCKINPRINRVWKVGEAGKYRQIGSSEWMVFRAPEVCGDFFKHYFRSGEFRERLCADVTGVGGSLTRAQPSKVATFPVPLPPLPEQRRIADKLDALLARVDAGRERLERVPKLVKQFRQAVLSGELTREWRGGGEAEWEETTLGVVARWSSGGTPSRSNPAYFGGPIPWVKTGELRESYITSAEESLTLLGLQNSSAKLFPAGTVLIAIYGATIGRVGILGIEAATNQACAAAIPVEGKMTRDYLYYFLRAEKAALIEKGQGGAQPNISQAILKEHEINLPSLPEQAEIVRRVEALFAIADRLEQRYQSALASFDRLTPALLAKAFRGELVPQDPTDEPAAVLLERIRAQRGAEGTGPKRGRKPAAAAREDGAEPKRRGRPPKAQAEGVEAAGEPKRRGRPPKARAIPTALNEEEAIRLLQERGQQRAEGARLVGLFEE